MYKIILAFILVLVFSAVTFAQETNDNATRIKNGEDVNMLYRNEQSFGIYVHSAGGIGVAYRRGKHVTGTKKKMFEIEMQNFRSPKEVKNLSSYATNGYVYGKLNSVLLFRVGVGYQNIIYKKVEKKNVEVRFVTFVGLTAAFAKPTYLYIVNNVGTQGQTTTTIEKYDPTVDNQSNIYGKAPFSYGLENTKVLPAGYVKMGFSFDYADRYDAVKALEGGIIMDAYPQVLNLMAFSPQRNLLFSIYIKMIWGQKWF
jgi:hypothetical protein